MRPSNNSQLPGNQDDQASERAELDLDEASRKAQKAAPGDTLPPSEVATEQPPARARQAGLTEADFPGEGPTDDDAAPETLLPDDGSEWPAEPGGDVPTDKTLSETTEIGGGKGLDEAELARSDPLDKKPWDGDPDEPLQPMDYGAKISRGPKQTREPGRKS